MVEEKAEDAKSTEEWLKQAEELVPFATATVESVKSFRGRWKNISAKLEQLPSRLSDLASHPCFTKNSLCSEQLQAVVGSLQETVKLAADCTSQNYAGKLQMQSNLDALAAKLDLNLHDCGLLVKTGVLGEATLPLTFTRSASGARREAMRWNVRELLARLQIGHMESKHRALDALVELIAEDEKNILAVAGRSNVSALVQLLSASSPRIREKSATVICCLAEAESCEQLLVSEGALPPLVRLLESGSPLAKERATLSLQRLTASTETARSVAGHGGVPALVEICQTAPPSSVTQTAAAGALRNLAAVPEVRHSLAEEGIICIMINLLDTGGSDASKEFAADCLQHLTAGNEGLRRTVVSEGGIQHLLKYLDSALPYEPAVGALRNLTASVNGDALIALGILPRLVNVLKSGSLVSQQAAASTICRISTSAEVRKLVGESGCITLLVKMLEAKANAAQEMAAQALASLLQVSQNCREIRKEEQSIPNLVHLLDPLNQTTAKKYAIQALSSLATSKKCKKLMIACGARAYLKKLAELEVLGAKKLLERLERSKFRGLLFGRK
uniref:Armadillo repeat-containing domain-containing protein n=1 Tax=Araucaria cunninghamii TaxID=56994 RepID=A0A0D6R8E7_ARACU